MCTVVILFRPGHAWPLILAANRDEMIDRPWQAPGRHWPERPRVVAGKDQLAGGTWLGLNDAGVIAAMLNRPGSLGPAPGKLSRGELPLMALDHGQARAAAEALGRIEARNYRTFNMVVADRDAAYWFRRADESQAIEFFPIPAGLSMITAHDRNDLASPRIRHFLPRFAVAAPPDPGAVDWAAWQALLLSGEFGVGAGGREAMFIAPDRSYGTVSSSLVALPARASESSCEGTPNGVTRASNNDAPLLGRMATEAPVWLFASGFPNPGPFARVAL